MNDQTIQNQASTGLMDPSLLAKQYDDQLDSLTQEIASSHELLYNANNTLEKVLEQVATKEDQITTTNQEIQNLLPIYNTLFEQVKRSVADLRQDERYNYTNRLEKQTIQTVKTEDKNTLSNTIHLTEKKSTSPKPQTKSSVSSGKKISSPTSSRKKSKPHSSLTPLQLKSTTTSRNVSDKKLDVGSTLQSNSNSARIKDSQTSTLPSRPHTPRDISRTSSPKSLTKTPNTIGLNLNTSKLKIHTSSQNNKTSLILPSDQEFNQDEEAVRDRLQELLGEMRTLLANERTSNEMKSTSSSPNVNMISTTENVHRPRRNTPPKPVDIDNIGHGSSDLSENDSFHTKSIHSNYYKKHTPTKTGQSPQKYDTGGYTKIHLQKTSTTPEYSPQRSNTADTTKVELLKPRTLVSNQAHIDGYSSSDNVLASTSTTSSSMSSSNDLMMSTSAVSSSMSSSSKDLVVASTSTVSSSMSTSKPALTSTSTIPTSLAETTMSSFAVSSTLDTIPKASNSNLSSNGAVGKKDKNTENINADDSMPSSSSSQSSSILLHSTVCAASSNTNDSSASIGINGTKTTESDSSQISHAKAHVERNGQHDTTTTLTEVQMPMEADSQSQEKSRGRSSQRKLAARRRSRSRHKTLGVAPTPPPGMSNAQEIVTCEMDSPNHSDNAKISETSSSQIERPQDSSVTPLHPVETSVCPESDTMEQTKSITKESILSNGIKAESMTSVSTSLDQLSITTTSTVSSSSANQLGSNTTSTVSSSANQSGSDITTTVSGSVNQLGSNTIGTVSTVMGQLGSDTTGAVSSSVGQLGISNTISTSGAVPSSVGQLDTANTISTSGVVPSTMGQLDTSSTISTSGVVPSTVGQLDTSSTVSTSGAVGTTMDQLCSNTTSEVSTSVDDFVISTSRTVSTSVGQLGASTSSTESVVVGQVGTATNTTTAVSISVDQSSTNTSSTESNSVVQSSTNTSSTVSNSVDHRDKFDSVRDTVNDQCNQTVPNKNQLSPRNVVSSNHCQEVHKYDTQPAHIHTVASVTKTKDLSQNGAMLLAETSVVVDNESGREVHSASLPFQSSQASSQRVPDNRMNVFSSKSDVGSDLGSQPSDRRIMARPPPPLSPFSQSVLHHNDTGTSPISSSVTTPMSSRRAEKTEHAIQKHRSAAGSQRVPSSPSKRALELASELTTTQALHLASKYGYMGSGIASEQMWAKASDPKIPWHLVKDVLMRTAYRRQHQDQTHHVHSHENLRRTDKKPNNRADVEWEGYRSKRKHSPHAPRGLSPNDGENSRQRAHPSRTRERLPTNRTASSRSRHTTKRTDSSRSRSKSLKRRWLEHRIQQTSASGHAFSR